MSRSRYRTVKGQLLDFDKFRALNGTQISIGNMGVNARGDQVNAHGDIIKTRNEIMKEKYLDPKAKYNPVRSRSVLGKSIAQTTTQESKPFVPNRSQPSAEQSLNQEQRQQRSQPSQSQPQQVEEYNKPGVVDLRHRVLGQTGFDLRGSLANAVSVDLTTPEQPKPTTLTTLRRI